MQTIHLAAETALPVPSRDGLGCAADKLATDLEYHRGGVCLYRKGVAKAGVSEVATPASVRGYLVGVSTTPGHRRTIFRGRSAASHDFGAGSVYLRNFAEDYHAELDGPFDFLLMELSTDFLRRIGEESGSAAIDGLRQIAGEEDPVLCNLVRAMAPTLDLPGTANGLFVDQLSLAIGAHLLHQYGGVAAVERGRRPMLSRFQERQAKDMLEAHLGSDISMSDVAEACRLSRGYFIRAFRQTTGVTPHQWLLKRRVDRARELVETSDLPLAEIAIACGFTDQSHLNRHFSQMLGISPGRLRRSR